MYFLVYAIFMCELHKIFLRDMMDNQCANIFSTHATVYGSHSVMFAFIERENIFFMCILNLFFLVWFVFFYLSPPPKFSSKLFFPKRVLFFLFLQGEKLVFNLCCSSQGDLPLFFIELNCFMFPWFSFFSHAYCHSALCLSCLCQYVTKRGRNK